MDRSDPLTPKNRFPHPAVTSNLAPHLKSAHHDRGEGSIGKSHNNDPKPFVVKILTSKPSAIKILHTLFANPAPSKLLQGQGGGGGTSKVDPFSHSVPSHQTIVGKFFPPEKSTSPYWFLPFDLGLLLKDFLR
jgi:hypothetical protein